MCIQWSPCGEKFAIASAGKDVSVCYTDGRESWWGAAIIRKHNSAIMGISWHPGGDLLATASTDCKCRILYASPLGELPFEMPNLTGWHTAHHTLLCLHDAPYSFPKSDGNKSTALL